jgi:single-stranded-DNA-specific exonuclease
MEKMYVLDVPFAEKDKAKSLGASWDAGILKWICKESIVNNFVEYNPHLYQSEQSVYQNPFRYKPYFPKDDIPTNDFVVLDTETTGRSNNDEVIELSILDTSGNEIYHSLFNPEVPISYQAAQVSHISMAEISLAPSFKDEWPKIKEIIGNRPIVAYNVAFDERLLTQTAIRYGATMQECKDLFNNRIDAMRIVQQYAKKMKLQDACNKLGFNIEQTHRASDDCVMILYVFDALGRTPADEREQIFIDGFHPDNTLDNNKKNDFVKSENTTDNFIKDQERIFSNMTTDHPIEGLQKVRDIIRVAIEKQVPIWNVSDYDVDGITAAYIMKKGFERLGAKDFHSRLPLRQSEGYGFSEKIADEIIASSQTPGLLITTDNGIASAEAINKIKRAGWTVVVTDHHMPVTENGITKLPDADVIIDPNALTDSCQFHGFCGAGLAYKLFDSYNLPPKTKESFMKDLRPIAAIATIADMVPLIEQNGNVYTGDNWQLVKDGLQDIRESRSPVGFRALIERVGKNPETITEEDIGYTFAPILNSASRMYDDGAMRSLELLLEEDYETARSKANGLFDNNEARKQLERNLFPKLCKYITQKGMDKNYPIVVSGPIPEGIIGIMAGKLEEKYHTTAIVFTQANEEGLMKGSARAIEGENIKEHLDLCKNLIFTYGGHVSAAGLSVQQEDYYNFRAKMQETAGEKPQPPAKAFDYAVKTTEVPKINPIQEQYAPYGEGHPRPVWLVQNVQLQQNNYDKSYYMTMGADKSMLKLKHDTFEAVEFSGKGLQQYHDLHNPTVVDLIGEMGENVYNGIATPQMKIMYIEPASRILEQTMEFDIPEKEQDICK